MLRAMLTAVSGLRNHQTYLDVVGNNIANVNTLGYRTSRVAFQDLLSQTLRPGSGPQGAFGGVNPMQVGLGASLASIDTIQTQGTLQATGKLTDLALQGNGYFVLSDGTTSYYSRDGAFDLDAAGRLVNPAVGLTVMGWQATNGVIDPTQPLSPLTIPLNQSMRAAASTSLGLSGNLDVTTAVGDTVQSEASVRDSLGVAHSIQLTYTHTGTNTWTVQATSPEGLAITPAGPIDLTFDANGQIVAPTPPPTLSIATTNGANPVDLTLELSGLTQLSGASSLQGAADGNGAGSLTTFTVDQTGIITGVYSNGVQMVLGQIAVATCANPGGLLKVGENLLQDNLASGTMQVGTAGTNGRGMIAAGVLEMSNVDLAQELTNMIMAERGFQANSRVITASDQILQNLVSLGM